MPNVGSAAQALGRPLTGVGANAMLTLKILVLNLRLPDFPDWGAGLPDVPSGAYVAA